ncbi:hypothetical protein HK405_000275 [Cladochytrium tenue]|nr:hypothetical protein HK405_000275 [Cladochytrium tenue]
MASTVPPSPPPPRLPSPFSTAIGAAHAATQSASPTSTPFLAPPAGTTPAAAAAASAASPALAFWRAHRSEPSPSSPPPAPALLLPSSASHAHATPPPLPSPRPRASAQPQSRASQQLQQHRQPQQLSAPHRALSVSSSPSLAVRSPGGGERMSQPPRLSMPPRYPSDRVTSTDRSVSLAQTSQRDISEFVDYLLDGSGVEKVVDLGRLRKDIQDTRPSPAAPPSDRSAAGVSQYSARLSATSTPNIFSSGRAGGGQRAALDFGSMFNTITDPGDLDMPDEVRVCD